MDSEHRKIELQSPADLAHLTSQLRAAARQKLDLHLPPVSDTSTPDDLRRSVEDLVDAFVAQMLHGMRHNISINGIDVVSPDGSGAIHTDADAATSLVEREEFEPFDDKLRAKLGAAVARRDALVARISLHRRTTPAAAAAAFTTRFEREDAEARDVCEAWAARHDEGEELEVCVGARYADVERNWERAVEGLQRLNQGLPETRARLERAGDVVGYLGAGQVGGK